MKRPTLLLCDRLHGMPVDSTCRYRDTFEISRCGSPALLNTKPCMGPTTVGAGLPDERHVKCWRRDRKSSANDQPAIIPREAAGSESRHRKIVETAKQLVVQWSPALKAVIERLQTLGPDIRPTLPCNLQEGRPAAAPTN